MRYATYKVRTQHTPEQYEELTLLVADINRTRDTYAREMYELVLVRFGSGGGTTLNVHSASSDWIFPDAPLTASHSSEQGVRCILEIVVRDAHRGYETAVRIVALLRMHFPESAEVLGVLCERLSTHKRILQTGARR